MPIRYAFGHWREPETPSVGWLKHQLSRNRKNAYHSQKVYKSRIGINSYRATKRLLKSSFVSRLQSVQRGRQVRKLTKGMTKRHGLVYNPYTKRQVRYTKPTHRYVYNPYAKTHTKIKLGKPTHRLIYNPYSKKYSKHECRSPLCGCS
jgi:hypothetical protein